MTPADRADVAATLRDHVQRFVQARQSSLLFHRAGQLDPARFHLTVCGSRRRLLGADKQVVREPAG